MKNTPYQSGERDQKIKIIRDVETDDDAGGKSIAPQEIYSTWALIKPGKPSARLEDDAQRVYEEVVFNIRRLPASSAILESDRILCNGVIYQIRGIPKANPRNQSMDIFAERGVFV